MWRPCRSMVHLFQSTKVQTVPETIVASVTLSIPTVQKKKIAKIAIVGKPPGSFFSSCEVICALPSQGGRAAEAPLMGGWLHTPGAACECLMCAPHCREEHSPEQPAQAEGKEGHWPRGHQEGALLSPLPWPAGDKAPGHLLPKGHGLGKVNVTRLPSVPSNWRQERGKKLQKGRTDKHASLWSYQSSGHSFWISVT